MVDGPGSHGNGTTNADLGPTKAKVNGVPGVGGTVADHVLHPNPRAALHWVLDQFDAYQSAASARLWTGFYPQLGALLYRLDGKLVVVIGDNDAATAVRRLLPCHGWRLQPIPIPGTPLTTVHRALCNRIFNALAREGFTTVEEVAAVPDNALRDVHGMGFGSINALRSVIAAAPTASDPDDDAVVILSGCLCRSWRRCWPHSPPTPRLAAKPMSPAAPTHSSPMSYRTRPPPENGPDRRSRERCRQGDRA